LHGIGRIYQLAKPFKLFKQIANVRKNFQDLKKLQKICFKVYVKTTTTTKQQPQKQQQQQPCNNEVSGKSDFTNILGAALRHADPKSKKNTVKRKAKADVKAAHKMLVKLIPGCVHMI